VSRGWSDPAADFVGFIANNHPNFSLQGLGLVCEMCSAAAIEKLQVEKLLDEPLDVPEIMRSNPSLFLPKWFPLPQELNHQSLRFQMQNESDWDRVESYLEAAGDDLSWQRLAKVAERNVTLT
jgi:spore coat polysaccharide biosynthesis protein SpsF (cytidylyltransferase family)